MIIPYKIFYCLALTTSIYFTITGCASGPSFQPAPAPQKNQALVYFMRGPVSTGSIRATDFSVNQRKIVSLRNYGYSWIYLDEGTYTFGANSLRLRIDIAPQRNYYLNYQQEIVLLPNALTKSRFNFHLISSEMKAMEPLKRSRYKQPTNYHDAELLAWRFYDEAEATYTDPAYLRIKNRNPSSFYKITAEIYENGENCSGGQVDFSKQINKNQEIILSANIKQSIKLQYTAKLAGALHRCTNILTFSPKSLHNYLLDFKQVRHPPSNKAAYCEISITDKTNNEKVPFRPRQLNSLALTRKASFCTKHYPTNTDVLSYEVDF